MGSDARALGRIKARGRLVVHVDEAARGVAPVVWLVGPWDEGELAVVRRAVDGECAWPVWPHVHDATAGVNNAAPPPEVILLAQRRPGVDEQSAVDRLQAAAPLARIVVVAGSWCEGELRTGRPLAGLVRIYWYDFPAWWRRAVAERVAGRAPHWSAPPGAMRLVEEPTASGARRRLAVDARDFATFEALAAALAPLDWECAWTPRGRGDLGDAAAGIWDGGQLDRDEQTSLRAFCRRLDAKPQAVIALLDFPRAEHVELAAKLGAAVVVGKPYRVDALAAALERLFAAASPAEVRQRTPCP